MNTTAILLRWTRFAGTRIETRWTSIVLWEEFQIPNRAYVCLATMQDTNVCDRCLSRLATGCTAKTSLLVWLSCRVSRDGARFVVDRDAMLDERTSLINIVVCLLKFVCTVRRTNRTRNFPLGMIRGKWWKIDSGNSLRTFLDSSSSI